MESIPTYDKRAEYGAIAKPKLPSYLSIDDNEIAPILIHSVSELETIFARNITEVPAEQRPALRSSLYQNFESVGPGFAELDFYSRTTGFTPATVLRQQMSGRAEIVFGTTFDQLNFPTTLDFYLHGKPYYEKDEISPMTILNSQEIEYDDQQVEDFDESKWVNKNKAYTFTYVYAPSVPARISFDDTMVDAMYEEADRIAPGTNLSIYAMAFNTSSTSRLITDTTFNLVSSYLATAVYLDTGDALEVVAPSAPTSGRVRYTVPNHSYLFHDEHKESYRRVCQQLPFDILSKQPFTPPTNSTWSHEGCEVVDFDTEYTVCACDSIKPQFIRVFFHDRYIGHYIRIKLKFKDMFLVAAIFAALWIVLFFVLAFISSPLNTRIDVIGLRHLLEQWKLNSPFYFEKYSSPRDASFLQLFTERVWIEWRNGVPFFSIFSRYTTHHYSSIDRTITLMMMILTAFTFSSVFLYDDFDINWKNKNAVIMAVTGVICLACNFLFEHMYRFNSDRLRYFIFNYAEQLAKLHYTGASTFFLESECAELLKKRSPTASYLNIAKAARWPEPPAKVVKDATLEDEVTTMEQGASSSNALANASGSSTGKSKSSSPHKDDEDEDDDEDDAEINFTVLDFKRRDVNVLNEIMRIELTLDEDHLIEMYRTRPMTTRLRYGKHNWTGYIFSFIWIICAGFVIFVLKGSRRGASIGTDINWIWTSIAASGLCIAFSILVLFVKSLLTTCLLKRREDHKGPEHPYLPNTENHRRLEMTKFAVRRYINHEKTRLQRIANGLPEHPEQEHSDEDATNRRGTMAKSRRRKNPGGNSRRVTKVGGNAASSTGTSATNRKLTRRRRRSTAGVSEHNESVEDIEEHIGSETGVVALQVEEGEISNGSSAAPSQRGSVAQTNHAGNAGQDIEMASRV